MVGAFIASLIDKRYHGKHRGKLAIMSTLRSIVFVLMAFAIYFQGWKSQATMGILFIVSDYSATIVKLADHFSCSSPSIWEH